MTKWWRGLLEDPQTKLASHAKLLAFIGGIIASGIMVREAYHDRMNSEYFWAYLGILVAGAAASKWISTKRGGTTDAGNDLTVPKE